MVKLSAPEERKCKACERTFMAEWDHQVLCNSCWKIGLSRKLYGHPPLSDEEKLKLVVKKLKAWEKVIKKVLQKLK